MQRSFMYRDMGTVGVDVVSWPSATPSISRCSWFPSIDVRCGGGR